MIDNTLDGGIRTRTASTTNTPPRATSIEPDGHVPLGVGIHLTLTKKRRKQKGELTKYLEQHWCRECDGKKFKSTYVCSLCGKTLCHTKTGRTCFIRHVDKCHPLD